MITITPEQKKQYIESLEEWITQECDEFDLEDAYDDMIDECYSFESVGGIFAGFRPSKVLLEMDPTAYRCGMNDYGDSLNLVEMNGDCFIREDVESAIEEHLDTLKTQLLELEERLENGDYGDAEERRELKREAQEFRDEIKTVEEYAKGM